jgi:hypothetical protein
VRVAYGVVNGVPLWRDRRGELVKVRPRKPKGGRSTDPDDYPSERSPLRNAPDRIVNLRQARTNVGTFAERLLDAPFPMSNLRQGQKLLRLAERDTAERLGAACAPALGFEMVDVR